MACSLEQAAGELAQTSKALEITTEQHSNLLRWAQQCTPKGQPLTAGQVDNMGVLKKHIGSQAGHLTMQVAEQTFYFDKMKKGWSQDGYLGFAFGCLSHDFVKEALKPGAQLVEPFPKLGRPKRSEEESAELRAACLTHNVAFSRFQNQSATVQKAPPSGKPNKGPEGKPPKPPASSRDGQGSGQGGRPRDSSPASRNVRSRDTPNTSPASPSREQGGRRPSRDQPRAQHRDGPRSQQQAPWQRQDRQQDQERQLSDQSRQLQDQHRELQQLRQQNQAALTFPQCGQGWNMPSLQSTSVPVPPPQPWQPPPLPQPAWEPAPYQPGPQPMQEDAPPSVQPLHHALLGISICFLSQVVNTSADRSEPDVALYQAMMTCLDRYHSQTPLMTDTSQAVYWLNQQPKLTAQQIDVNQRHCEWLVGKPRAK